jgi:hypothetical protein
MRLTAFTSRALNIVLFVLVAGCHRAPHAPNLGRNEGRRVGDTAAFAPRLIDIDRARHRVTFQVNVPAYVLLFSVVPGKTVQPLGGPSTAITPPGRHSVTAVPKDELVKPDPSAWTISQQVEYERCVARGRAALPKKTVVRHDSTGREFVERTDAPQDPSREFAIERRCENAANQLAPAATTVPADRYLVVLASNTPLTLIEIAQRIEAMTVYTDDVESAIASITQSLYGDRRAIWSGHYIRW